MTSTNTSQKSIIVQPRVLRTKAAAAYIGVSPWKLREICQQGKLDYFQHGQDTSPWLFSFSDLDAYLGACPSNTKSVVIATSTCGSSNWKSQNLATLLITRTGS